MHRVPYAQPGWRNGWRRYSLLLGVLVFAQLLMVLPRVHAAVLEPDPIPDRAVARVIVTATGLQELAAATLTEAGLALDQVPQFQLWRAGSPVALEQSGAGSTTSLRFFAPPPGDRWNHGDTYWLTLEPGGGLRMAERAAPPGGAAARSTAVERGSWRKPTRYDSTQPGARGDHWFSADLRTGPGQAPATLNVPLGGMLPAATGPLTLTLRGVAFTSGLHQLAVSVGDETRSASWSGRGSWTQQLVFPAPGASALLTVLPGTTADGLLLDDMHWEQAVRLEDVSQGAAFTGVAGSWSYNLGGLGVEQRLYDVSVPARPVRLIGVTGGFSGSGPVDYVLSGPRTLGAPVLRAHRPTALPAAATAVYVAPAELHQALAPLVAHRRSQGHTVTVVAVEELYNRWSGGQVDPEAIRSFLRYAAATWSPAPLAVTLVGDGTSDPLDYTGRGNSTLIPPYLAPVDPWLGEAACDTCYAQLDGDDPLSDPLPDLAIGRLPVKSAAELSQLVTKLIGYETATGGVDWRSRALLVADNGREANGAADPAGDFATLSDHAATLLPQGMRAQRVYFDPWGRDGAGQPLSEPWREADPVAARARTVQAFNQGAGLLIYTGHSNQWQWAFTGPPAPQDQQHLLGLYDPDTLTNGSRLPIVLAMTCLTSAFQTPAFSGTTLDERLLLQPNGGAVAVWGPTGLGVAYGHDLLLQGFLARMRAGPATLGELTVAGLRELHAQGGCCQSALRTYVLLGDPLTPAQAIRAQPVFLPLTQR